MGLGLGCNYTAYKGTRLILDISRSWGHYSEIGNFDILKTLLLMQWFFSFINIFFS